MRKLLLGAAAVLALVAMPNAANAAGGYIDIYGGNDEIDIDGLGSANSDLVGVDAVAGFSNAQLGAHYTTFNDLTDEDSVWTIDGHLFARNPNWQLGAGLGYSSIGGDESEASVAVEGLMFFSHATIGGTVFYSSADDLDIDFTGIDGEVRFFATDNFRIGGRATWGTFNAGTGSDGDFTGLGVNAEFQLSESPLSIFAAYNHGDADGFESDAWNIGARWNFGGQSLMERDRNGPNLNTLTGGVSRLFGF